MPGNDCVGSPASRRQAILSGMTVVDLGTGMAPALVSQQLYRCGADVVRVEPEGGDPFYARYPAYPSWHDGKDVRRGLGEEALAQLLAAADVLILGGEDHPDLGPRPDAAALHRAYPGLVLLDIAAYPACMDAGPAPANEFLAYVATGLPFEQGEGPHILGYPVASCGAAIQGLIGTLAAIHERLRTGAGALVTTSLYEGALSWGPALWYRAEVDGKALHAGIPKNAASLVFRCRDGRYIQIALGAARSKGSLYRVLGIDDPSVTPDDSGFPSLRNGDRNFFGDIDVLAPQFARFDSAVLLADLLAAGVPCSFVEEPGGCWNDEQVRTNGIITTDSVGNEVVDFPMEVVPARAATTAAAKAKPFEAMRFLDFGTLVAGPLSGIALVDLGAEVIKVETHSGDLSRNFVRSYRVSNRGKLSLSVDLKSPEGQEICRRLLASADMVESNFRGGVAERLGVDVETLGRELPHLAVLEATAFGARGPKAALPGYDQIFQAMSGIEYCTGGGGDPICSRFTPVDFASAYLGSAGLLLGLIARARTGSAAGFRANLLNSALFMMSCVVRRKDASVEGALVSNAMGTGRSPGEAMYQTADGWIAVSVVTQDMGARLLRALGDSAERIAPVAEWGEDEARRIAEAFARGSTAEWLATLEREGVWAVAVPTGGGAILDQAGALRDGLVVEFQHPKFGRLRQLGRLFQVSTLRRPPGNAAHGLGEDTRPILASLGYSAAEVDDLFARGVCR